MIIDNFYNDYQAARTICPKCHVKMVAWFEPMVMESYVKCPECNMKIDEIGAWNYKQNREEIELEEQLKEMMQ